MHELFSTGSSILCGFFYYLLEMDPKNVADGNPQMLMTLLSSILADRYHIAPVCREWLELLSTNQSLSLSSLHLNVFGCRGAATEIVARYRALKDCHFLTRSLEAFFCEPIIQEFLRLPWRLRVARLDLCLERSDTLSREIFGHELDCVQNLFSPQTFALAVRAIAEFPSGDISPRRWPPESQTVAIVERAIAESFLVPNIPTRWPPATDRRSPEVYMQYELLNFRPSNQHEIAPDEFIASFKDVNVYSWRNLHHERGTRWAVKVVVQLSSTQYCPSQIEHEVKGTCMFTFRARSFGSVIRVSLGSRLDLTLDFITLSNS